MYHGPNLDGSSVVNLGNVCLPRFTFGCFYCTPGFGMDDPVVFHIGGSRLLFDCFETMKLAAQLLSSSVADALDFLRADCGDVKQRDNEATVKIYSDF